MRFKRLFFLHILYYRQQMKSNLNNQNTNEDQENNLTKEQLENNLSDTASEAYDAASVASDAENTEPSKEDNLTKEDEPSKEDEPTEKLEKMKNMEKAINDIFDDLVELENENKKEEFLGLSDEHLEELKSVIYNFDEGKVMEMDDFDALFKNKTYLLDEMTGAQFNQLFNGKQFCKLTNEYEKQGQNEFKDGLMEHVSKFQSFSNYYMKTIDFVNLDLFYLFVNNNVNDNIMWYVRKVTIPDDARVKIELNKFYSNKLIFEPRQYIWDNIELVKRVLEYDGTCLKYVDKSILNYDLYKIAVNSTYLALEHVDHDSVNSDKYIKLCKNALSQTGKLTKGQLMRKLQISELGRSIYVTNNYGGYAFQWLPTDLKTYEFKKMAVSTYGPALQWFTDEQDEELCEIAVNQRGLSILHVREDLLSEKLYEIAVSKSDDDSQIDLIKIIPKKILTEKICLTSVLRKGESLEFIPNNLKTDEICEAAVKQNYNAIQFVPKTLKNTSLYDYALSKNYNVFKYVPSEYKTKAMCYDILQNTKDKQYLTQVPDKYKDEDMCKFMINELECSIEDIPTQMRNKELCDLLVEKNGDKYDDILKHVPLKLKTKELCLKVVQKCGMALKHVPIRLRTKEICKLAVDLDVNAYQAVPDEYKEIFPELKKIEDDAREKEEEEREKARLLELERELKREKLRAKNKIKKK